MHLNLKINKTFSKTFILLKIVTKFMGWNKPGWSKLNRPLEALMLSAGFNSR
jgi:hypothetical protein